MDWIFQSSIDCKIIINSIIVFLMFFSSIFPNPKYLSLHMFFENGEYTRRAMEPKEDQVGSIGELFYIESGWILVT